VSRLSSRGAASSRKRARAGKDAAHAKHPVTAPLPFLRPLTGLSPPGTGHQGYSHYRPTDERQAMYETSNLGLQMGGNNNNPHTPEWGNPSEASMVNMLTNKCQDLVFRLQVSQCIGRWCGLTPIYSLPDVALTEMETPWCTTASPVPTDLMCPRQYVEEELQRVREAQAVAQEEALARMATTGSSGSQSRGKSGSGKRTSDGSVTSARGLSTTSSASKSRGGKKEVLYANVDLTLKELGCVGDVANGK
jgi:hypothetical protein